METLDYNPKHWEQACPKYDCRKDNCKCGMKFVSIPAVLGDDSASSTVAPKNGAYCNAVVKYEANGDVYMYSKDGVPVLLGNGDSALSLDKMPVVFTKTTDGSEYPYTWESNYSFEDLLENPENIRVGVSGQWLCAGSTLDVIPARTSVSSDGNSIEVRVEIEGYTYTYYIVKPMVIGGKKVNTGYFNGGKDILNSVEVARLPELGLSDYAVEIPDGTTITIDFSLDHNMYSNSTSDCEPIQSSITGYFMVLPVSRKVHGSYGNAVEDCLITETSSYGGPSNTPNVYRYKTFYFNGQKYKMTYTSMNDDGTVWTINKVRPSEPIPLTIANADTANWMVPGSNIEMGIEWGEGTIISDNLTFIDTNTSNTLTLSDLFDRLEKGEKFALTIQFDSLAANEEIWGSRDIMGESTVIINNDKSKSATLNTTIYNGYAPYISFSHYDDNWHYGGFSVPVGIGKIDDRYIFVTEVKGYNYM